MTKCYFECHLKTANYFTQECAEEYAKTAKRIHRRFKKLELALAKSGLSGERFSAAAAKMFDKKNDEVILFDTLSVDEIVSHVLALSNLVPAELPKRIEWVGVETVVDTAFVTEKEWLLLKKAGIGGSDAEIIAGDTKYRNLAEIYYDKIGVNAGVDKNTDKSILDTFTLEFGHQNENLVVQAFAAKTRFTMVPETRMFRSTKYPWMVANPDAVFVSMDGKIWIFEAKTSTFRKMSAWESDKVPFGYLAQCQHYGTVFGTDERLAGVYIGCIFGNLISDFRYVKCDINPDSPDVAALIAEEQDFYECHLMQNACPDDVTSEQLSFYERPKTEGSEIDSDAEEIGECVRQYWAADDARKAAKKQLDVFVEAQKSATAALEKFCINAFGMNPNLINTHIDGKAYVIKMSRRKGRVTIDKDALGANYPELLDKFAKVGEGSSAISIKEIKPKTVKAKKEKK